MWCNLYMYVRRCFLNPHTGFIWAFIVPVITLMTLTFVLLVVVVRVMWKHQSKRTDKTKRGNIRLVAKVALFRRNLKIMDTLETIIVYTGGYFQLTHTLKAFHSIATAGDLHTILWILLNPADYPGPTHTIWLLGNSIFTTTSSAASL